MHAYIHTYIHSLAQTWIFQHKHKKSMLGHEKFSTLQNVRLDHLLLVEQLLEYEGVKVLLAHTENGSRNIPNTVCGLVGTFLISAKMFLLLLPCVLWVISGTISNMFLIPNNIRNTLSCSWYFVESFYNVPNMALPINYFSPCWFLNSAKYHIFWV